jgi:hypothetical protein
MTAGNFRVSRYLDDIWEDWQASSDLFPKNLYPAYQWPMPFFGNPRTAVAATIGVNPSSGEFSSERHWGQIRTKRDWKERLKGYFNNTSPLPHRWFGPWKSGLQLLNISYESGRAAHFDVSYRATKAMIRNKSTDRVEFRRMVERDIQFLFRLLPLCDNLRLLLVFGPMIRSNGTCESLADFIATSANNRGMTVIRRPYDCLISSRPGADPLLLHQVFTSGEKCVKSAVVRNLRAHQQALLNQIARPKLLNIPFSKTFT